MDSSEFLPSPEAIERLRQDLEAYESKRSGLAARTRWRLIAMMGAWALPSFLVLGVGWDIWLQPDNKSATFLVLAVVVFGGLFAYSRARKPAAEMQEAFREHLFPMIFGFIGDMRHSRGVEPDSFAAIPDDLTGYYNRKSFDDRVTGRVGDLAFELFEARLSFDVRESSTTVFKGVILVFDLPEPFTGRLFAARRKDRVTKWVRDVLGTGGLVEVKSGDPSLDERFEFRSDNAEKATNLLHGGLSKTLSEVCDMWPQDAVKLGLKEHQGFLMLPVKAKKNFFELPGISVPLDYSRHIAPIIADMSRILTIGRLVREATRTE